MPTKADDGAVMAAFGASPSFLLTVLSNRTRLKAAQELRRELDLSVTEWAVIGTAGAQPGASPTLAVDVAALDKSVVSRSIKGLVARGIVEVRPDPSHGRKTRLYLTPAGEALHDQGLRLSRAGDEDMLRGLSKAEVAATLKSLHGMLANVQDGDLAAIPARPSRTPPTSGRRRGALR